MFRYDARYEDAPQELRDGLRAIEADRRARFTSGRDAVRIEWRKDDALSGGGAVVRRKERCVAVHYGRRVDAFRALGRLLGARSLNELPVEMRETARFDTLGVMLDVSRNSVLTVPAVQSLMRRFALMGINALMLYAEDVYEVPGEPFFGYLRGAYTHAEMKTIAEHAELLGIEMFPCIQTLGHLGQALQWPAYSAVRDTSDVLLVGDERTYELIEKMICAACAPFSSRRINVGMDEALGMGTGRYRELHGARPPYDILIEHVQRVRDICVKHGLKPMMWSDLVLRYAHPSRKYLVDEANVPPEVIARLPKDMRQVFWHYSSFDPGFYVKWIERHRALGSEPLVATAVWNWTRSWPALPRSFGAIEGCMRGCRQAKCREVFVTTWGSVECDTTATLPGIQYFAEHGYADSVDPKLLRRNFAGSCDSSFDAWVKSCDLDAVPGIDDPANLPANVSHWLLWQDPLISFMDPQVDPARLAHHYRTLHRRMSAEAQRGGLSARLRFPTLLSEVLAVKVTLRERLASAYRKGDRRRLAEIRKGDLLHLRRAVRRLWKCHRGFWLESCKPWGLEVLEQHYGGLVLRLDSLSDRLNDYIRGRCAAIPELETSMLKVFDLPKGQMPSARYARARSPSCYT